MRELKFRVWDDFLNDWHATGATTEFIDKCNKGYNFNIVCFGNPERVHIEQYTGIKDKNGKEIYEGDIVKCGPYSGKPIVFEEGRYWLGEEPDDLFVATVRWVIEVIGNIHENQDLLEDTNVLNKEEE